MTIRHFHRPVVRSSQRNAVALTNFLHAGFRAQAVQQRPDLPGLAKGIVNHKNVFRIVAQVGRNHVPNLEAHREGAHQHHDGHHILHDDDDFAVNRLGLEPERTADNLDGLRLLDQEGRYDTGQDTQNHDEAQNQQHIDRRNRLEDGYLVLQQAGNRRTERLRQQDGQQHRDAADERTLRDDFQEDAALVGTYQAPGGHFLGPEARQGGGHIDIIEHCKCKEQDAHRQQQVYETSVPELNGLRPIFIPIIQEIHVPKRNQPNIIVLALVHPEILFAPIQDVTLPGLQVGTRIGHHKADATAGIAHVFVV